MLKAKHLFTKIGVYYGKDCIGNINIETYPNLYKKIDYYVAHNEDDGRINYIRAGSAVSVKQALDMMENAYMSEEARLKQVRSETLYDITFRGETIGQITESQSTNANRTMKSYRARPIGQAEIGLYKTPKSAITAIVRAHLNTEKENE